MIKVMNARNDIKSTMKQGKAIRLTPCKIKALTEFASSIKNIILPEKGIDKGFFLRYTTHLKLYKKKLYEEVFQCKFL
jgi:hypothetical protein